MSDPKSNAYSEFESMFDSEFGSVAESGSASTSVAISDSDSDPESRYVRLRVYK